MRTIIILLICASNAFAFQKDFDDVFTSSGAWYNTAGSDNKITNGQAESTNSGGLFGNSWNGSAGYRPDTNAHTIQFRVKAGEQNTANVIWFAVACTDGKVHANIYFPDNVAGGKDGIQLDGDTIENYNYDNTQWATVRLTWDGTTNNVYMKLDSGSGWLNNGQPILTSGDADGSLTSGIWLWGSPDTAPNFYDYIWAVDGVVIPPPKNPRNMRFILGE